MDEFDKKAFRWLSVCVLLLILCSLAFTILSAKMEAEAYNRATGANVSTWDALWIELRVQAAPKEDRP